MIFRDLQNKLIKHFARRKYPKEILKEIKGITHNKRLQLLEKIKAKRRIERPLPFVTTYARYTCTPTLNKVLQTRWSKIYDDYRFCSLLPNAPFPIYKNVKALKSLLSAKRRRFETYRFLPDLELGPEKGFRFVRFNYRSIKTSI